jgi:starch phosphorylase
MTEVNPPQAIAYFSMEIALESELPTYSGGLGVLAGDTVRSAADLAVPLVAVTLLYRKGYFKQQIDSNGWQHEEPIKWSPGNVLEELPQRVSVRIEGRTVRLRAWRYRVKGVSGFEVPVLFLDADSAPNSQYDRSLTDYLYGGDAHYRICQEVILGIGGVRMLHMLGYRRIERYHMNEGHASLLTIELLDEHAHANGRREIHDEDIDPVRRRCVFTTHTPVPAGHDKFPMELVNQVLGRREVYHMKEVFCCEGVLNMTFLALNLSHYINGVAKRHGEISRRMFSRYAIDSITNGVHAATWAAKPFRELFDRYITDWRRDNFALRSALGIPRADVAAAHMQCKQQFIERVKLTSGVELLAHVLTLGFARRATAYKRAELLFTDIERLKKIAKDIGEFQVVYAGKAHPADNDGKRIIQHIIENARKLSPAIKVVYLQNYNMELAALLAAGVDVWLNTPEPPLEASGTSGMKAALNGVPSLSVLDGWWIEGCIEGVTGWSIGKPWRLKNDAGHDRSQDAASLYEKLETAVIPTFYKNQGCFADIMRHCIALNGSFFNTHRMLEQYVQKAYFL